LIDKNMPKVRLNFAPHAYLFQNARKGADVKTNVLSCIYTAENKKFIHSSLRGVDECNDFGKICINNGNLFNN